MPVMIACRGCGVPVAEDAHRCFVCNCPAPTCHVSHVSPTDASTQERNDLPTKPSMLLNSPWPWLAAAGLVGLAGLGYAGVRLALWH
ncbi:MAG TPA: hypothetical protein VGZ47_02720 [Gemmataceae bacterium]|jgi:hypothetical protein|nr:hypothetical protein [Gemmataceae bacterium]